MSSNWISARRVKFQEIDAAGNPVGEPTYGVIVSDDFIHGFIDFYESLRELEDAIAEQGMVALAEDSTVDFDVDNDDPRWKGDNYCGIKNDDEEDDDGDDETAP